MKTCFSDSGRRPVSQYFTALAGVAVAVLATCLASTAEAAVYAQYTFNDGSADDSGPNGLNGDIVDPKGTSSFVGGGIDLTANNAFGSGQDFSLATADGAYVDLPNGIVNGAANEGSEYDLSLEIWFTEQTHRNWARLFDLGVSDGGEDVSTSGAGSDYLLAVSGTGGSGGAGDVFTGETHYGGTSGGAGAAAGARVPDTMAPDYVATAPLAVGVKHQVVLTLAQNGTTGGAGDNGIATLYHNGVSVGTAPIVDGLFLDAMVNDNNWLGRSQYGGDQLFDGSFDEFTIYDTALSSSEVMSSFTAGPVEAPFPTLVVNRDTGEVSITNSTSAGISLTGYSITSADGSLDVASWDSVAPDSGWTRSSEEATDTSEAGGTAQALAASGGSLSLGDLWFKTPTQDLLFSFETAGGDGAGEVIYTGEGYDRSDLNGDGDINASDWSVFLANNAQPLGETTLVGAYLKGDLNGDLNNNHADFVLFKQDYIAANGAAAFAALGAVPEPSALALCGIASVLGLLRRRRTC